MLEELVHKSDGTLVSRDPYVHYATLGAKVVLVDEKLSATNHAHIRQGAIGCITEQDVKHNRRLLNYAPEDRKSYEVNVSWNKNDCTRDPGLGRYEEHIQYVMLTGTIEPYHD